MQYIILSLKHSTKDKAVFWGPNNSGYTGNPWLAGIYSEEQVKEKLGYYNDRTNSLAINIKDGSTLESGLKFTLDISKLKKFIKENPLV